MTALEKVVDSILPCFGTGTLPLTARVERLEMALGIRPIFSLDLNARLVNVEARYALEEGHGSGKCEFATGLVEAVEEEEVDEETPVRSSEPAVFQTPPFDAKGCSAAGAPAQVSKGSLFTVLPKG